MQLYTLTKENIINFTSLAPGRLLDEVAFSNQYGIGVLEENEEGTHAAGIILFYHDALSATIILKWIYVAEGFRDYSIGQTLMDEMIRLAKEAGVNKIVASLFASIDNLAMMSYLEDYGFGYARESTACYFLTAEEALDISTIKKCPISKRLAPLNMVRAKAVIGFFQQSLPDMSVRLGMDVEDFFDPDKASAAEFDVSCVYMDENKLVRGAFLVGKNEKDVLETCILLNNDKKNALIVLQMIKFALEAASKKYGPQIKLDVRVTSDAGVNLAKNLIDDEKRLEYEEMVLYL